MAQVIDFHSAYISSHKLQHMVQGECLLFYDCPLSLLNQRGEKEKNMEKRIGTLALAQSRLVDGYYHHCSVLLLTTDNLMPTHSNEKEQEERRV